MGTKHLTEADRFRARTLFFDAGLPKARICQITGFSLNQVKLAIREKTPKTRSGRPPRRRPGAVGLEVAATSMPGGGSAQGAPGPAAGEHGAEGSLGLAPGSGPGAAIAEPAAAAVARLGGRIPQRKWEAEFTSQSYFSWLPSSGPTSPTPASASAASPPPPPPLPPTASLRMSSVATSGISSPAGRSESDARNLSSSTSSSSLASSTASYSSMSLSSPIGGSSSAGSFSLPSILATTARPL